MSVMNMYFRAGSDDAALASPPSGPEDAVFGVDPVVQVGTFAALLTDRPYDEISGDPEWARLISDPESPESWTVSLPDTFTSALADATADHLSELAEPWSRSEEFMGQADPTALAGMLGQLKTLAVAARDNDDHLYCLISL
jgi:hypothetical protein